MYEFTEKVEFYDERDQRWNFGFVGGAGVEYRFARHWAAQVELRYYYSTVSTVKALDLVKDYRYNSTLALQAGLWYTVFESAVFTMRKRRFDLVETAF